MVNSPALLDSSIGLRIHEPALMADGKDVLSRRIKWTRWPVLLTLVYSIADTGRVVSFWALSLNSSPRGLSDRCPTVRLREAVEEAFPREDPLALTLLASEWAASAQALADTYVTSDLANFVQKALRS